jgi:hypothetical protein
VAAERTAMNHTRILARIPQSTRRRGRGAS